jgi:hypothetical protein
MAYIGVVFLGGWIAKSAHGQTGVRVIIVVTLAVGLYVMFKISGDW